MVKFNVTVIDRGEQRIVEVMTAKTEAIVRRSFRRLQKQHGRENAVLVGPV